MKASPELRELYAEVQDLGIRLDQVAGSVGVAGAALALLASAASGTPIEEIPLLIETTLEAIADGMEAATGCRAEAVQIVSDTEPGASGSRPRGAVH